MQSVFVLLLAVVDVQSPGRRRRPREPNVRPRGSVQARLARCLRHRLQDVGVSVRGDICERAEDFTLGQDKKVNVWGCVLPSS